MINENHIAAEARRLHNLGSNDNLKNWYDSIENLKIFPNFQYELRNVEESMLSRTRSNFGLIYPSASKFHPFLMWYRCREEFEASFFNIKPKGIFICEKDELRVPNFIRNIEIEKLSLNELTTFMKVKYRDYIYINPSSFWTSCQMRFSLFTLFLRAGNNYYYNSIEDVILKNNYGKQTFPAIQMFFNGKRNFTGKILNNQHKWVWHYANRSQNEITTLNY